MSSVMIITILGTNKVSKTMEKCLLSKSFVYKLHTVDFYNTFIFVKESFPLAPAVFFNASDKES
jgi:hypothetical protein